VFDYKFNSHVAAYTRRDVHNCFLRHLSKKFINIFFFYPDSRISSIRLCCIGIIRHCSPSVTGIRLVMMNCWEPSYRNRCFDVVRMNIIYYHGYITLEWCVK